MEMARTQQEGDLYQNRVLYMTSSRNIPDETGITAILKERKDDPGSHSKTTQHLRF